VQDLRLESHKEACTKITQGRFYFS